jgi:hypothetical protein
MKKFSFVFTLALTAAATFAQDNTVVRWNQIIGDITAPGIDNPIGATTDSGGNKIDPIHSAPGPWTARGGHAHVNLTTGEGAFDVEGLVLNGGNASGTPGPVASVIGTLVCNPGTAAQAILDTPAVALSSAGNAQSSFRLTVPTTCAKPVFLIRAQTNLRWLATGAVLTTGSSGGSGNY